MKKISLKKLNLKEVEKLSREQLKNILGGWTGESGTDDGGVTGGSCGGEHCFGDCVKDGVSGSCMKKAGGDCICATATIPED